ncbi:MAG: hypothetical protein J3Q66DRAFT_275363 [Benniella sp.]|nr:MAG: hypothetical protein J3Q66DRAFT_275363 [Benniella sp.]
MDLTRQLDKAGFNDIAVVPVALHTVVEVAESLEREMKEKHQEGMDLVVFQLCDGTELDGYPGVSMVRELERRKIAFTGSDSMFYVVSSSKPVLKRELQAASVPTSPFQEFMTSPTMDDLEHIINEIGFPMIVKPSISYASINISMASVVHTPEQLLEQINASLTEQVDIETPSVFVERFLAGHEFTALVVGDKDWGVKVYSVAERVFDPKLGKFERLLAFDQYWDGYDLQGGSGNNGFCQYQIANEAWQEQLKLISKDAYLALGGSGYGRVDIRTTEMGRCEPVVLEVNANCGLSFEKDSSSLANILIMSDVAPPDFVLDLVDHALHRNRKLNGQACNDTRAYQPNSNVVQFGSFEILVHR